MTWTLDEAEQIADLIDEGAFDRYLELILNAAHNRKRTLRWVPGFSRHGSTRTDRKANA